MGDIFNLFKKAEKPTVQPIERLVVFLGNPGKEYALTRHNAGMLFASYFQEKNSVSNVRSRFHGVTSEAYVGQTRILALCPMTYMNASGQSVKEAADFYKIPPEKILVICDDVNFDVGKMRIRRSGSDGGQRGLRNIIEELNSDKFPRVKVGVGKKPDGYDMKDWVLSRFTQDELNSLNTVFEHIYEALPYLLKDDFDTPMSKYN